MASARARPICSGRSKPRPSWTSCRRGRGSRWRSTACSRRWPRTGVSSCARRVVLAMAIIDHFRRRGAMVVATTHFDALKTYASTTSGVASAGFGFDPTTFAPTYRLAYGSPGSSLALEIAARLGLPAPIIEQARAHRGERESQLADHLAKVERELQGLEHERRLVARERQTIEETTGRLAARDQDLRDREETFRRRLDQRLEERLRDARREIDAVVEA